MYRAIIYRRSDLDKPQVADIKILSGSICEDLTQKASSTLITEKETKNIQLGDLLKLYDSKGIVFYWGVVTAINNNEITCSQFQSFYNDNLLFVAQTSTNQTAFYNNSTVSYITDFYLKAKENGYQSIANSMSSSYVPTFSSLRDVDVADTYKNVYHTIIDNEQTFMPYPLEKSVKNIEEYLYDTFNTYNRIIRPFNVTESVSNEIHNSIGIALFYPSGIINYNGTNSWDYSTKTLFDEWEMIDNVKITEKKFEYNTVAIYNDAGTTLRGTYTVLNDGTIQKINNGQSVSNRYGVNKTAYVFDGTNKVADLARANLPSIKYNHEIVFDIEFLNNHRLTDYNLGMPIAFYSGSKYESILTAWKYDIDQSNDTVKEATFTLGKVRKNLTSMFNLRRS